MRRLVSLSASTTLLALTLSMAAGEGCGGDEFTATNTASPGQGAAGAGGGASGGGGSGEGGDASGVGGASGAAGSGGKAIDPARLGACKAMYTELCDLAERCSPFAIEAVFGQVATCRERMSAMCNDLLVLPGVNVDEATMQACAGTVSSLACDAQPSDAQVACSLVGALDNGSPCRDSLQCASGACARDAGQACGTCKSPLDKGEDCGVPGAAPCGAGLVCSMGKCQKRGSKGEPCSATQPCDPGLACAGAKCVEAIGEGQQCQPLVSRCDPSQGLYCDPDKRTCLRPSLNKVGDGCGLIDGKVKACDHDGYCALPEGSLKGTCTARIADGEACPTSPDSVCLEPSKCLNGRCTPPGQGSCQ